MKSSRRQFVHRFVGCLAGAGLVTVSGRLLGQPPPLRMAVHPYNSTLALIGSHRGLVQYLIRTLGRHVEFFTAPSFDEFLQTLMAGGYDIALCPPHFAVLAMQRGYVPLFNYRPPLEPILVVGAGSVIRNAADFRGKRIAMADPYAFIRLVMVKWLEDAGLRAGRDYEIVEKPTHGAAVAAVTLGEVDGGLATISNLRQAPEDIQRQLFGLTPGLKLPHVVTLANGRLGDGEVARIREALAALPATAEGREFFAKIGVEGYAALSAGDLRALQPYVDIFLRMKPELAARLK